MQVSEIMTQSVRTVETETNMYQVASQMCLYRYSGLPVVEGDKLLGFIAEKDVLHYLFPSLEDLMENMAAIDLDDMMGKYKELAHLKVKDLMQPRVITVSPDMHILKAASIMVGRHFRRIPVAKEGRLVGMISLGDVHKAIFQQNLQAVVT